MSVLPGDTPDVQIGSSYFARLVYLQATWRYTRCANINFLREVFRKSSSDRIDRNYKACHFAGGQEIKIQYD